jgi:hypothetical protein
LKQKCTLSYHTEEHLCSIPPGHSKIKWCN